MPNSQPTVDEKPKLCQQKYHPPRLQHSPSLPNIWCPPSRGPIPEQFKKVMPREHLHLPITPPSLSKTFPLPLSPTKFPKSSDDTPKAESTQLPALASPKKSLLPTKFNPKRQQSHELLTPALTPSSSIGTSASTESNVTDAVDSATRFLLIGNLSRHVEPTVSSSALTDILTASKLRELLGSSTQLPVKRALPTDEQEDSPIRRMFVKHVPTAGIMLLLFHDIRYALAAKILFSTRFTDALDFCLNTPDPSAYPPWLTCRFLSKRELCTMTGDHKYTQESAAFCMSLEEVLDPIADYGKPHSGQIVNLLMSYGAVSCFEPIECLNDDDASFNCHVEYYDIRHAEAAFTALNGKPVFNRRARLTSRSDLGQSKPVDVEVAYANDMDDRYLFHGAQDDDPWSPHDSPLPNSPTCFYTSPPSSKIAHRTDSSSSRSVEGELEVHSESVHDNASQQTHSDIDDLSPQLQPYIYSPEYYHSQQDYSMIGYCASPPPIFTAGSPPPAIAHGYDNLHHHLVAGMNALSMGYPFEPIPAVPFGNALYPHGHGFSPEFQWHQHMPPPPTVVNGHGTYYDSTQSSPEFPGPPFVVEEGRSRSPSEGHLRRHGPLRKAHRNTGRTNDAGGASDGGTGTGKTNALDIAAIESGIDPRTTVMIKNIPNKMCDRDLLTYINKVCPRRIDFMYLRVDFRNGCNVGYAFVNFIQVEDLLHFAKAKLGEKWNMFASEKVLQMSYANYQGKEALIDKFKNSSIMDLRESWQPKIFQSEPGPHQGLIQQFPQPTHMRRKERSLHNRGNLYTPGGGGSNGMLNAGRESEDRSRSGERRPRLRMPENPGRHFLNKRHV